MAKVLVIRKPDRTVHVVPMANKAAAMAYSNKLQIGQRWSFEEMEVEEAEKLPFMDDNFVTADNASVKLKAKDNELAEKDRQLAELQAQLEALKAGPKKEAVKAEQKAGEKTGEKEKGEADEADEDTQSLKEEIDALAKKAPAKRAPAKRTPAKRGAKKEG